MKKTYMNPEMEVVDMMTQRQLLAGSTPIDPDSETDEVDVPGFNDLLGF